MLFSSIVFHLRFAGHAACVLSCTRQAEKHRASACKPCFYAWGEPVYVILMVLSILFNYVSGIDIERNLENPFKAKQSLVIAVAVNLLILGVF